MGKDADELVKDTDDISVAPIEKKPVEKLETDGKTPNKLIKKPEEKKIDTQELRKVIKIGEKNKIDDTQISEKDEELKKNLTDGIDIESSSRDALEQKRAILQSIKDFDFLIKKNSEEISSLNKKIDSITKDLDDLVSLYEIVSEQMNPFVGLSKVTKKRLDTLENFNKEIEEIKTRMGDIEIFVEKTVSGIETNKIKGIENNTDLSTDDLDKIIEKSFNSINIDQKIDELIEEFIENIKIEM